MRADERQPRPGRYVHFWAAAPDQSLVRGFGAYIGSDGNYSGALQFQGRADDVALPSDSESFISMIRTAFPALPQVSAPISDNYQ